MRWWHRLLRRIRKNHAWAMEQEIAYQEQRLDRLREDFARWENLDR